MVPQDDKSGGNIGQHFGVDICGNGFRGGVINNGANIGIIFAIVGIGISPVNLLCIMHTMGGRQKKNKVQDRTIIEK